MLNSRFSGDTCTAFENFQENPNNNTLSSILPCDELLSAQPVLSDVSAGIYNLVNQVNVIVVLVHMLPEQSILLIKWNLMETSTLTFTQFTYDSIRLLLTILQVNSNISLLQATIYPNLASVCNPFSAPPEYVYQPDNCPANTIRIGDIPKVCRRKSDIIYVYALLLVSIHD